MQMISRLLFLLLIFASCSSPFVKEEQVVSLNEKYSGTYEVRKTIEDPSQRSPLPAGMTVKLFFQSSSESIRAYAYPANQTFEEAIAKQILYMIPEDYADEAFNEQKLHEELKKLLILE